MYPPLTNDVANTVETLSALCLGAITYYGIRTITTHSPDARLFTRGILSRSNLNFVPEHKGNTLQYHVFKWIGGTAT